MAIFNKYFSIFLVFFTLPIAGMEVEREVKSKFQSPTKTSVYFTNPENDGGLKIVKESLKKTGRGDTIFADLFVLSDEDFTRALVKQKKKGVDVSVTLCNSLARISKQCKEILENGGVEVNLFNPQSSRRKEVSGNKTLPQTLHKKVIGWTYQDSEDSEKINYRVFHGSRNPSYMTKSYEGKNANKEIMTYEVDKETYDHFYGMHNEIKKMDEIDPKSESEEEVLKKSVLINYAKNSPLSKTPTKKTTIETSKKDVCRTIAERIANTQEGGKLWFSIYALTHPKIMEAIKDKQENIQLMLLDQGCLKKDDTRKFLEELENQKNIYVYNTAQDQRVGRCPTSFHIKGFVRQQEDKYLVGLGSTNYTTANNNDINDLTLYPPDENEDNQDLAQDVIKGLESYKTECDSLEAALNIFYKNQEQQKEKKITEKKAKAAAKNQASKKKKKEEVSDSEDDLPPAKKIKRSKLKRKLF